MHSEASAVEDGAEEATTEHENEEEPDFTEVEEDGGFESRRCDWTRHLSDLKSGLSTLGRRNLKGECECRAMKIDEPEKQTEEESLVTKEADSISEKEHEKGDGDREGEGEGEGGQEEEG